MNILVIEMRPIKIPDTLAPEKGYSRCGGYVGYLRRFSENAPIPRECLTCPKLSDCAMETIDSHARAQTSKRLQESKSSDISHARFPSNLIDLFLIAFGSITLVWVGHLTWHDITVWNKDIALIFFGSRTGENISLGIGMKVIHYLLIGLSLLLLGLVKSVRVPLVKSTATKEKDSSRCSHHFGFLRSLPNNHAVPQECITCQKVLECRNLI